MKIDWKKDKSGNPINQEFHKRDPVSARVITGGVAVLLRGGLAGGDGDFIVKDGGDDEIIISKEEFTMKFITEKEHRDKINNIVNRRLKDKTAEIKTLKAEIVKLKKK